MSKLSLRIFVILSMAPLTGCLLHDPYLEKLTIQREDCLRDHSALKPATPRVKCIAQIDEAYARATDPANLDLTHLLNTRLIVAAERFDADEMTVAEFEAAKAKAKSDYHSEVNQRVALERNTSAIEDAARTLSTRGLDDNHERSDRRR